MPDIDPNKAAVNLARLSARIPTLVGNEIVSFALDNWDKQGFQGSGFEPWEDRKDQSSTRAILVGKQSGRLRRSIRVTRKTNRSVEAGSDLDYADIHNTGGVINVKVTKRSKKFFWAMYSATGDDRWKFMALSKKSQFRIRMPRRQFIGNSPVLDQRIQDLIESQLKKALGG